MATTIVGLFDKEQTAHHIQQQLESRGLSGGHLNTITWRSLSEGTDPWGIGGRSAGESPTGRLSNELQSRGVPATDAQEFAEAVRRGGSLVVTEIDDDQKADEIAELMNHQESVDLGTRRGRWKANGYSGFDPDADLYSSDEVERERGSFLETGGQQTGHLETGDLETGEEARMTEAHEELRVGKRDVETGGIRVNKRVETREVEEDVNLREEHVRVERSDTDGRGMVGDDANLFNEESIEVTEHAEEPVVEKNVRVEGEVRVGKDVDEHTETIRDTVRETVIDIEDLSQGVSEEHAFSNYGSDYREHYQSNFGGEGERYEDYEPAYRYGHTFGSSDHYSGKDYTQAEPDIRQSYEQNYGKGSFDRFTDAARHAYDRVRGRGRRS